LRRAPGSLAQFVWGPTGSVGYELATRVPAATSASDLDLLILTPEKMPDATAIRLLSELNRHAQNAGVRVDVQLETPAGGVALAELAAGKPHVMVRAAYGPALVTDPWAVTTTRHA
jgi:phosphoribosyl-dephospho-CoA transferase